MIINIEIPGITGPVRVEGDFATETAINRLTAAMSGSTSSLDRSINDISDDINDFGDDLNQLGNSSRQSSSKIKDFGDNINVVAERLSYRLENLARDASGSGISAQSLTTSIGSTVGSLGKLGGLLGPIGGVIGGVFETAVTGLSGLAGAAVGMIEQFADLNSRVFDAGLGLSNGFDGIADAADVANVPIHEFGNALLSNINSLRLMSGGGVGGIRAVSNAFAKLTPDLRSMLFSLGYTTEDIVGAMADYSIDARMAGKNLSSEELAVGTTEYLKNVRELSRLTGKDIKSIREKIDADRANLFVQRALLKLGPEQRREMQTFIAAIPAGLEPMRDFILTGQSYSQASGVLVSQFPIMANIMREAAIGIEREGLNGQQAQARVNQRLRDNSDRISQEYQRVVETFGIASAERIQYADMLGAAGYDVNALTESAKAGKDAFNANQKSVGGLTDLMGIMKTAVQSVIDLLQSNFVDLLQGSAPTLSKFFKGISNVGTELDKFTENVKKYFFGNEQEQETAKENLIKTIEEWWKTGKNWVTWIADTIWDSITGAFKGLYEVISQGITNALNKFWNMIANSSVGSVLGIQTAEQAQIEQYEKEIQALKLQAAKKAGVRIKNERGGRQRIMADESEYLDNKTSQEIQNLQKKIQATKEGKVGLDLSVIENARPVFTNEQAANTRERAIQNTEMTQEQTSLARKSVELQEKQLELYKSTIEKNDEQIRILKQQVEELTKARNEARANAMARS